MVTGEYGGLGSDIGAYQIVIRKDVQDTVAWIVFLRVLWLWCIDLCRDGR